MAFALSCASRFVVSCVALLTVALASSSHADDLHNERTEGLNFELTPYLWAPGIDGKVQLGSRRVHFNQSFSDLIEHVDAGFMGLGVVSYDRFVFYGDYDYIGLSADGRIGRDLVIPSGTRAQLDTDLEIWTLAGGYRLDTFAENTIDLMLGTRTLNLDNQLKALGSKLSNDSSLTDTIAMLRPSFRINDRWRFNPTLSYGISGDSQTTYELMPQMQYQFADSFALRFGYKRLYYKQDKHPANTPAFEQMDTSLSGLFLGVGWTFPTHAAGSL